MGSDLYVMLSAVFPTVSIHAPHVGATNSIIANNIVTMFQSTLPMWERLPDPTRIYIFRGKKYICEKIEMSVGQYGVDREKTGYFYEFL
mgnify:CR=1 FL=1